MNERSRRTVIACVLAGALGACGPSGGSGALEIRLQAEDTIPDGLPAGEGSDDVVDGWSVDFSRFLVAIGDVRLTRSTDAMTVVDARVHVVDLASLDATGHRLLSSPSVASGAWDVLSYRTAIATHDAVVASSVAAADFEEMVARGCTFSIEGTLSPAGADAQRCPPGGSCSPVVSPIAFELCVPAATLYSPCQDEGGVAGVVVVAGGSTTANITIHGDHLFFNGFPEEAEGSVVRRAQWLADADTDGDGVVTQSELESIGPGQLGTLLPSTFDDGLPGYSLGGAPSIDGHGLDTAWDYVRAQLTTVGHFQGEGDCVWSPIDG